MDKRHKQDTLVGSGGFNNIDNYSIASLYNPTKAIHITNNLVKNFHIGTYISNIGNESTTTINANEYVTADLTNTTGFYGTAIAIENTTQTDNVVKIYDNTITNPRIGIALKKVNGAQIYKDASGNIISFPLGNGSLSHSYYGISLDHCDDVFVHENTISNNAANSSTDLRGLNVVTSTGGNVCSNIIDKLGYGMYFEGHCENTILKLCTLTVYEKAIFFSNAYFSQQGSSTETWENVFDDALTTKKRLDGNLLSNPIDWHYNSANSKMDVSNTTPPNYYQYNGIPSKINPNGITGYGISDCDPLPERMRNIAEESDSYLEYHLYPNPSNDYFIVEQISSSETFEVIVFDVTGRKLISKSSNSGSAKIDASKLPTGLYNVIINQGQQFIASKKIIVQH